MIFQRKHYISNITFKKASKSINEIKLKWTEKLKEHQADGYSKQECLNFGKKSERLEILTFLKSQALPDSFTKSTEVKSFTKSNITAVSPLSAGGGAENFQCGKKGGT